MTCMYIKPEVKRSDTTAMANSYRWSLYRVFRWKLLFNGEGATLLVAEDVNL